MLEKMKQMPEDLVQTRAFEKPLLFTGDTWEAWIKGKFSIGPIGYGASEQEAVENLHDKIEALKPAELSP